MTDVICLDNSDIKIRYTQILKYGWSIMVRNNVVYFIDPTNTDEYVCANGMFLKYQRYIDVIEK